MPEAEPTRSETYRLFISLSVPEEVKSRILAAQRELQRVFPGEAARWTKADQFHLTLRFLGAVAAERTALLVQSLEQACHGFGALHLRGVGIGAFPKLRFPRVLWAGVADREDRLPALCMAVQKATNEFTTEEPEDKFSGHITVARIKSIRPREAAALAAAAEKMQQTVFGEWTCSELGLMRSQLSPAGARHTVMAAITL